MQWVRGAARYAPVRVLLGRAGCWAAGGSLELRLAACCHCLPCDGGSPAQPPPGTAPCTGEVGGLMPMLEVLVLHLLYLLPPRLPGK